MIYDYKCPECEVIIEHEAQMGEELPKNKQCPKCGKKTAVYDVSQMLKSTTKIPDHMRAMGKETLNYSKMSREQKTFY